MASVVHNVKDIDTADRPVLERVIGQPLTDNQQLIIGVVNVDVLGPRTAAAPGTVSLPDWCNVYHGLSDEEACALEQVILTRADLSRHSE